MIYTVTDVKAAVLEALVAAGAEVTIKQNPHNGHGFINTVNGYAPRWELRTGRFMGRQSERVDHINVGRGRIGKGLRIINTRQGLFDFAVIAQALIDDVARQVQEDEARARQDQAYKESWAKEHANAVIAGRIVAEHGARVDMDMGDERPSAYQRTAHCKLTAVSWGIKIETTATDEDTARAIVAAIEHALKGQETDE